MLLLMDFKNMDSRKMLLVDGIGALVSTFLLSIVLVQWQSHIGMPVVVLYWLGGIAGCLAIYSLSSYRFAQQPATNYVRIIASANSLYILLTTTLIIIYYKELTWLGIAYFIGEIMLVLYIIWIEFKIISHH